MNRREIISAAVAAVAGSKLPAKVESVDDDPNPLVLVLQMTEHAAFVTPDDATIFDHFVERTVHEIEKATGIPTIYLPKDFTLSAVHGPMIGGKIDEST